MTIRNQLSRIGAAAALAAALSACATAPTTPAVPQLNDMLSEASKAAASGNKEQAITLWKKSAEAYPKEKAPWSSIAQTRYENRQYGDAIQAALEVLVRDPNDTLANSIIAVSGLRLSTTALSDLSRQNHLSGSIKSEAQDLAKLLRTSLGEAVLVTTPPAAAPQPRAVERPTRTANRRGAPARPAGNDPKPASGEGANANPFSALK